jgi:alanine dehydrogenase
VDTNTQTFLLNRSDVERLLSLDECISAVEEAFRLHALGKAGEPGALGILAGDGGFHVKAAALTLERPYFAAKLNANFPQNGPRYGLPTIRGVLALCDATNGAPLAVMDSMSITALRTAAASAVAAKYLANPECDVALIVGCGGQASSQVRALCKVRELNLIQAYDQDVAKAEDFAARLRRELGILVKATDDLPNAVAASDIVITCTTSRSFLIAREMARPGAFIAAVGADNEFKQEIDPQLLAQSKVVVDHLEQCCAIGDLHHAIDAGVMKRSDVHAQLGEVIAGLKPGRAGRDEIIVFDSTGTALQDVAAAAAVYRNAVGEQPAAFAFSK